MNGSDKFPFNPFVVKPFCKLCRLSYIYMYKSVLHIQLKPCFLQFKYLEQVMFLRRLNIFQRMDEQNDKIIQFHEKKFIQQLYIMMIVIINTSLIFFI